MNDFFKKFYSTFLRQNWWLEDIFAYPSRPMLIGILYLGISIIALLLEWRSALLMLNSAVILCFLLMALTGILWLRIGKAPWYIVGVFGIKYEKLYTIIWVIFWGGAGAFMLLAWIFGR